VRTFKLESSRRGALHNTFVRTRLRKREFKLTRNAGFGPSGWESMSTDPFNSLVTVLKGAEYKFSLPYWIFSCHSLLSYPLSKFSLPMFLIYFQKQERCDVIRAYPLQLFKDR
jgi:hypothetical protein